MGVSSVIVAQYKRLTVVKNILMHKCFIAFATTMPVKVSFASMDGIILYLYVHVYRYA